MRLHANRRRVGKGQLERGQSRFPGKWLKSRPESGLDCLMCAMFARQRPGIVSLRTDGFCDSGHRNKSASNTRNQKPETKNLNPETKNKKPETRNKKPESPKNPHHSCNSHRSCRVTRAQNVFRIRFMLGDIRLWVGDTSTSSCLV